MTSPTPNPRAPGDPLTAAIIWEQPEPTDDHVWLLCPYMQGRQHRECDECPMWEQDEDRGKVKRGCRMLAEEACRVAYALGRSARPSDEHAPERDYHSSHEALVDLVQLWSEYEALNGGGPGWRRRFEAALDVARELVRVEP